ncbi:hypothetical protein [Kitasatospora sp. NPDC004272]
MTATTPDGWVTLPIRGQLDAVGPAADQDATGAYPLTISVRSTAAPALLHQILTTTAHAAAEERWLRDRAAERLLADQLARAYDFRPLAELEQEDPERVGAHLEAAEALRPWLAALPREDKHQAFLRGWERAKQTAAEQRSADATLAEQHLLLATELQVPCPVPDDPDRPEGAPVMRPEPLVVRKNTSGYPKGWEDGWLVLNPNLHPGDQVWTGREWKYRGELARNAIYRWTREEAIAEAQRLAAEESARYGRWIAAQRRLGPVLGGLAE